jgi:hypothetical protein
MIATRPLLDALDFDFATAFSSIPVTVGGIHAEAKRRK